MSAAASGEPRSATGPSKPLRRWALVALLPAVWAHADLFLRVDLPGAAGLQHFAFRVLSRGPQWLLDGEFRLRNALIAAAAYVVVAASLGLRGLPLWRLAFVGLAAAQLLTVLVATLMERAMAGGIVLGLLAAAALGVRTRTTHLDLRPRTLVPIGLLAGLLPLVYLHGIFTASSDGYRTLDWLAFLRARGLDGAALVVISAAILGAVAAFLAYQDSPKRLGVATAVTGVAVLALTPLLDPGLGLVHALPVALAGTALTLAVAPRALGFGSLRDPLTWPVRLLPLVLPAALLFGHAYGARIFRCPTELPEGLTRIADAGEVFQIALGEDGRVVAMTVRSERRLLRIDVQPEPGEAGVVDPADVIPAPGQEGMHPEPERPLDSFRPGETYARPENLIFAEDRGVFFGTVLSADPKYYEKTISPQNDVNNMIVTLDGAARRAQSASGESRQCWIGTLLWDGARDRVVAGCEYEPALMVFNPEDGSFSAGAEADSLGDVAAMALDTRSGGDALYAVSMWNSRMLTELGADGFEIRRQVPIGGTHYAMEFDPGTGRLFTSEYYRSRVRVVDADTLETVDTLRTGLGTRAVAVDSARGLVLASSVYDGMVRVCGTEDGRERARLQVGGHVKDIALDLERGLAYFASRCGVWRLDLASIPD